MDTDGALAPVLCEMTSFLNYFSDKPDYRHALKVAYRLDEILLLALLATMAGDEGSRTSPGSGTRNSICCGAFRTSLTAPHLAA